jgi:hypothetical protein
MQAQIDRQASQPAQQRGQPTQQDGVGRRSGRQALMAAAPLAQPAINGARGMLQEDALAASPAATAHTSGSNKGSSAVALDEGMGPVAEGDHEWEDGDGEHSQADVARLAGVLKDMQRQARETQREVERERNKLYQCISDKDRAIQELEVQLARASHESRNLAKRVGDLTDDSRLHKTHRPQLHQTVGAGGGGGEPAGSGSSSVNGTTLVDHLATLCDSLVGRLKEDPLTGKEEANAAPTRSKTTVGLLMRNKCVDDVVVGGPAFNSQHIHRGDELVMVNGHTVRPEVDSVSKLITGNDLIGSSVTLRMRKLNGTTVDVDLVRMQHERVVTRRKIHEILQSLRQAAVAARDGASASRIDGLVALWSQVGSTPLL